MDKYRPCPSIFCLFTSGSQHPPRSTHAVYLGANGMMAINKFQTSRLTFDLSLEVTHIGFPSIYQNTVFSETIRPIKLNFHMKTPFDNVAKIYTNCSDHIPKMADMPIYGKNPLKIFFSRFR